MELQFFLDSSQDENIKQSIRIANKFLNTNAVKNVLERIFRIDFDQCTKNIRLVRITYSVPNEEATKGHKMAWTERAKNAKNIYFNEMFRQRLDFLKKTNQSDSKEQQFLVIYMGILLIHEIAHLVLRWKGILNSPSDFVEAGDFLENKLFGGIVRLLVQPNSEWTKESECIGIGVERYFSSEGLKIYILAYRDYLKKIFHDTLAEDCYEAPKFLEKKLDKDTLALKQTDEQLETSSDWRKDMEAIIGPFMLLENIGVRKCGLMRNK